MKNYSKYLFPILVALIFSACASRPPTIYEYADQNNLNGVKSLSNTAYIDSTGANKYTALHNACDNGNLAMVKYLISKGANIEARTIHGDTPLIRASFKGHLPVVKYLLSQGANPNSQSNGSVTPLITAVGWDRFSVVKALVEGGADINFVAKNGNTAIKNAKKNNKYNMLSYFEKKLSKDKKIKQEKQEVLAKKKQKEQENQQIKIVNDFLAKNDFEGLKKYTEANPNAVYFIGDKTIRLMLTGPKGLKVGDISKLVKKGRSERIIISLINRVKSPYKEFELDEIDILVDEMGLSDNVVAAMIDVTTQLLKDEQKKKEQEFYLKEQRKIAKDSQKTIIKEKVVERKINNSNRNSGGNQFMNAVGKEVGKELGKKLLKELF